MLHLAAARALTGRLLFCTPDPPYSRELLGVYSARHDICLSFAGVWAMTVTIDARRTKNSIARSVLSSHAFALDGREIDSSSFPVRSARANLGCSALIRTIGVRERAGGPPSVKSARNGELLGPHRERPDSSISISTHADADPLDRRQQT